MRRVARSQILHDPLMFKALCCRSKSETTHCCPHRLYSLARTTEVKEVMHKSHASYTVPGTVLSPFQYYHI
jgi:hypothetical protein